MSAAQVQRPFNINFGFCEKQCPGCGMTYFIPEAFERECRRDENKWWHCPGCGQSRHYIETTESQLRKQLQSAEKRLEWARKDAQNANRRAERHERRAAAFKGHATRVKNRVAHGVCPCCRRNFKNLSRHMEHQHPGYVESAKREQRKRRTK